ncbi:Crp/Fnr family transcriptional regulator [Arvimicrobium flavum]|uniref:Crp/Fnr family transcriptional regulator n=1 Tax=Arvimicrobium flavum TaxID=3393320 RepID=UPI00237A34FD|nr:Crp/Fnr family transcriptional regulator [Mesorhizobium shangrilense]
MASKADLVRAQSWACDLSDAEVERASRGFSERSFAAGTYICHRGDRLDHWTGVISGLIKISVISRAGKAMTFAGAGAGSWFGEGSVLKGEPRKYDVVAIRDTRLAMLNKTTFDWLSENSLAFNRFLVRHLNERMGQFIGTIEFDRILKPQDRVARSLSWFFNPFLSPDMAGHLEITQEELGLLAGVSRQIVNKSLQALQAQGMVEVSHGRIVVLDLEGLTRYES